MRILKKILIAIVSLIVLLLIIAIFVKKDFSVTRSVTINKPKDSVFNYIKYLKNQNDYSKWAKMDPNMKKTFTGTDGTPGFVSAWEGNSDVGAGEQEIKSIKEGERVDYELRFVKPFKSTATAYMSTEAAGSGTKVDWNVSGHMNYPMNIMRLFMDMDKRMGGDLETGLNNLKTNLEK